MNDQAHRLREIVYQLEIGSECIDGVGYFDKFNNQLPRILTFASTNSLGDDNISISHLSIGLAKYSPPIMIIDASMNGMNIPGMTGRNVQYSLMELEENGGNLDQIMVSGPAGINFSKFDLNNLKELDKIDVNLLQDIVTKLIILKKFFNVVVLYTGYGLSFAALNFILASSEIIFLTDGKDESVKTCYSLMKIAFRNNRKSRLGIVSYNKENEIDGQLIARKLINTGKKFINLKADYLGCLSWEKVHEIRTPTPFGGILDQDIELAKSVDNIAENIYNIGKKAIISS